MGVRETRNYIFDFGEIRNNPVVRVQKTDGRVLAAINIRADVNTDNKLELIKFRNLFNSAIKKFEELEAED